MRNIAVKSYDTVCSRPGFLCSRYSLHAVSPHHHKGIPFWDSENCHSLSEKSFVQQLWTEKQHNISHSYLKTSSWREIRGSASPLPSSSALWAGQSVLRALLPPWLLDTLCFCPRLGLSFTLVLLSRVWGDVLQEKDARNQLPWQQCNTFLPQLLPLTWSVSIKNILFPIVCSSILLSAAFQRGWKSLDINTLSYF